MRSWQEKGVVEQIGSIQETYGISHLPLLKQVFFEINVFDLVSQKVRLCGCGQVLIRDWDRGNKHSCQVVSGGSYKHGRHHCIERAAPIA